MEYHNDKKLIEKYSRDRSIHCVKPSFVTFPRSEKDLIELMHFAKKKNIPITPRGGGTGLSGAALGKGIIVDFSKHFTKITQMGSVTKAQSGVLVKYLRPLIEKHGYMLPSVPLHGSCSIGGNVNTRSVGPRSLKYGTIDKQVNSVRGIMSDGRILDTSHSIPHDVEEKIIDLQKQIKNEKQLLKYLNNRPPLAGGYNLKALLTYKSVNDIITQLIVGSVGTLMMLTQVELFLPKYKEIKDLHLLYFNDFDTLQDSLDKILQLDPAAVEYADKEIFSLWDTKYHHPDAVAVLIVGFESDIQLDEIDVIDRKIILSHERFHLWKSRASTLEKLEKKAERIDLHLPTGIEDTTFHPKDFSKIMKEVSRYAETHNIPIISYGHIGVGSIHLRPLFNMKKEPELLETLSKDIFRIVHKYGGTLVGEHNAGLWKSRYLEMESKKMYAYMKKVKNIFDPDNILNPMAMFKS